MIRKFLVFSMVLFSLGAMLAENPYELRGFKVPSCEAPDSGAYVPPGIVRSAKFDDYQGDDDDVARLERRESRRQDLYGNKNREHPDRRANRPDAKRVQISRKKVAFHRIEDSPTAAAIGISYGPDMLTPEQVNALVMWLNGNAELALEIRTTIERVCVE